MMNKRIFVAGHNGMVGSAIVRHLRKLNNVTIVTKERDEVNLLRQDAVSDFFEQESIDQVYLAAAKVGGIIANNNFPADFIYENLMISCNIIHAAHESNIDELLFLGSSCIYPKFANQPISESELLTGYLESTNEPYAVAKIAGIKLCESYNRQYARRYRSAMPTNLYGENDNFHSENSHVIPAIMRRCHEAKLSNSEEFIVWGSGTPMREFLHVDDLASACVHVMGLGEDLMHKATEPMKSHINIGTGVDCTIRELAETIIDVVGFEGNLIFDSSKPDGTPRKLLNVSLLEKLGWKSKISLREGLTKTYSWFLAHENSVRC